MSARLARTRIDARPGEEELVALTVTNDGVRVDTFTVEVVEPAWCTVDVPSFQLMPNTAEDVLLHFAVPRSSKVRGDVAFAVRVTAGIQPEQGAVEEGVIVVGAYEGLVAELLPRNSRGRFRGRHTLAVDNHGNTTVEARVTASDEDLRLRFKIDPPNLTCAPGTAAFAKISVRPRKRSWGSAGESLPFDVSIAGSGREPVAVNGAMFQRPLNGAVLLRGLLALLIIGLLLAVLAATVFRPVVRSFARQAVEEPLSQTNSAVNNLGAEVGKTNGAVNDIGLAVTKTNGAVNDIGAAVGKDPALPTNSGEGGGAIPAALPVEPVTSIPVGSSPGGGASAGASTGTATPGTPFDRRLVVNGTGVVSNSFDVPDKRAFLMTDLVFQNPAGDTGTISLLRGTDALFVEALANFRTTDYHFLTAVLFDAKAKVTLRVECQNPPGKPCTAGAYVSGVIRVKA